MAKVPYVVSLQGSISKTCFIYLFFFFCKTCFNHWSKRWNKVKIQKDAFLPKDIYQFYAGFKTWVSKIIFLCSTDITFLMQYSYTFKKLGVLKLLLDPTWSIADLGSYWLAVLSDISEWFIFIYNKM